MRDKMERLVILPFSVGCVSDSSVAVSVQQQRRRSKPAADSTNSTAKRTREEDEESLSSENMKYSLKFLPLPKPDISTGFNRLFAKSFKTLSQLFAYKEEIEEESEIDEMEIGVPTDVKHVTHIGLDGSSSTSPTDASWPVDNRLSFHDLFTFPTTTTTNAPSGQYCDEKLLPMEITQPASSSTLVHAST